jgi:hypothetical protein
MNAMAGAFAGESLTRDPDAEDPHMLQYVEAELAKRRQASGGEPSGVAETAEDKPKPPPGASLWETPAALAAAPRDDEESADRYLTGIVEVQLPAEVKFRNIEETERAKAELLKKQRRREFRGTGAGGARADAGATFPQTLRCTRNSSPRRRSTARADRIRPRRARTARRDRRNATARRTWRRTTTCSSGG